MRFLRNHILSAAAWASLGATLGSPAATLGTSVAALGTPLADPGIQGFDGMFLAALGFSLLLAVAMLSRRRRAERDLREMEDRIRRAESESLEVGRKLRAAEDHLIQSRKMEAVGRLAGGIAHDFNNLLTAINGYAELVLSRLSPADPNRPMIEEIRTAGDRAAAITRQLLTFSRRQLVSPVAMDLNAMIRDLDRMLARLLGPEVELATELSADLPPIHADPGQVGQVILNLALNGKDAMPEGGRLRLSTSRADVTGGEDGWYLKPAPGDYACLKVEDTGKGMDAQVKEHLFEPFFTTKPARGSGGARVPGGGPGDDAGAGTGMGLPTVYGIMDQSRGGIRMISEEGRGTAFHLYFPTQAKVLRDARTETARGTADAAHTGEVVLLVEDEENVRRLVASVLRSRGYEVLEASGAREALYLHENHAGPIQVLLTDVIMPGRSGRELAHELQRLRPGIRTIFMSGYTDDVLLKQGLEASKALFLGKPFTPAELLAKLAESEALSAARPG